MMGNGRRPGHAPRALIARHTNHAQDVLQRRVVDGATRHDDTWTGRTWHGSGLTGRTWQGAAWTGQTSHGDPSTLGALSLRYQPKIDLASGAVSAVEALVRWNHPVRGFVSPAEFIPVAERTDVIHPLTRAVIAQALEDCRSWLRAGTPLQVAVNLSARCLLDDSFPETLSRLLRDAGIPAPMLTLELTESAVMSDPDRMISMLHRLKALGVDLAVDDLGTGYSSVSYLERLPIDEIKIGRSFVMAMEDNDDDAAIVEAIVALGHRLSKRVVAEGVETAAAYRSLRAMGCDEAQGFYISRPLPPDVIPGFVHDWRPAVGA